MAPFSPLIAALFSVFLLCWQQSATNVESTVMECFIKTIDSGLVRSQLLVEELGQRWFLQSGSLALAIDTLCIFGFGLRLFRSYTLFNNSLQLAIFAQIDYAVKQLEEVVEADTGTGACHGDKGLFIGSGL